MSRDPQRGSKNTSPVSCTTPDSGVGLWDFLRVCSFGAVVIIHLGYEAMGCGVKVAWNFLMQFVSCDNWHAYTWSNVFYFVIVRFCRISRHFKICNIRFSFGWQNLTVKLEQVFNSKSSLFLPFNHFTCEVSALILRIWEYCSGDVMHGKVEGPGLWDSLF